jgi:hypothetical protein
MIHTRIAIFIILIYFITHLGAASVSSIIAQDGQAFNMFGNTLSIADNELLVGAPGICYDGDNQGVVYHYVLNSDHNEWELLLKFTADEGQSFDMFGSSLAFSHDYAIVSSKGNCLISPNSGVVYLFEKDDSEWQQTNRFAPANPYAADNYGCVVDINESYAAVGASLGGFGMSGRVYIYKRFENDWVLDSIIAPDDSQILDYFGYSLSLSDSTLFVGAPRADISAINPKGGGAGSAYIFDRIGGLWQQTVKLSANDPTANNQFGFAVDIDKDQLVIGAPKDDVLEFDSGSAYIYKKDATDGWIFNTKLSALDADFGDVLGSAVAISDHFIVVGAPGVDGLAENSGAIYSYLLSSEGWTQKAKKSAGDASAQDHFGKVVSISHATAAVGTPDKMVHGNEAQGAVYVFDNIQDLALPVQLANFSAIVEHKNVCLYWQTFSELNNLGFILQRKVFNGSWIEIASFQTRPELLGRGSASSVADYSYVDENPGDGFFEYRIGDVDLNGVVTFHSTASIFWGQTADNPAIAIPNTSKLFPAFPNPFNPETTLAYFVKEQAFVDLAVYDLAGRKVAALVHELKNNGSFRKKWNGRDDNGDVLGSGIYLIRIQIGDISETQKAILVR